MSGAMSDRRQDDDGERAARAEVEELRKQVERLRAWALDEQAKRFSAEDKLVEARSEIERLRRQALWKADHVK
jgi:hypothetical protein